MTLTSEQREAPRPGFGDRWLVSSGDGIWSAYANLVNEARWQGWCAAYDRILSDEAVERAARELLSTAAFSPPEIEHIFGIR